MPREHLNPPDLPDWSESFSQVVVTEGGGRTVYVSGQVSVDGENEVVGRGDLGAQARRAFENLERALSTAGARPPDVVRLGIYVKDYRPEQAAVIQDALQGVFGHDNLPASTWLGVQSLALEDLLIEVEATAVPK